MNKAKEQQLLDLLWKAHLELCKALKCLNSKDLRYDEIYALKLANCTIMSKIAKNL